MKATHFDLTGVETALDVDAQHQQLVELLNQMQQVADNSSQTIRLIRLIDRYNELTLQYFSLEEEQMLAADYPGYQAHKSMHDQSIEHSLQVNGSALLNDPQQGKQLVAYLRDWLLTHIRADREMSDYLKSHSPSGSDISFCR